MEKAKKDSNCDINWGFLVRGSTALNLLWRKGKEWLKNLWKDHKDKMMKFVGIIDLNRIAEYAKVRWIA